MKINWGRVLWTVRGALAMLGGTVVVCYVMDGVLRLLGVE